MASLVNFSRHIILLENTADVAGTSTHQLVLNSDVLAVSRVTFRFRNSKKSNNGTDANAGQIPQLLYRLPVVTECAPVTSTIGRKTDQSDAVHVLSLDFSHSVSPVSRRRLTCVSLLYTC